MTYTYKVLRKCFVGGVFREPDGRHDPYVTDEKLDPCPSALELQKGQPTKRTRAPRPPTAPQPDKVQGKVPGEMVRFEV